MVTLLIRVHSGVVNRDAANVRRFQPDAALRGLSSPASPTDNLKCMRRFLGHVFNYDDADGRPAVAA
jgi:hypothetical protein